MLDMGLLYNALITHRKCSTGSHRGKFSRKIQTAHITDLHRVVEILKQKASMYPRHVSTEA